MFAYKLSIYIYWIIINWRQC